MDTVAFSWGNVCQVHARGTNVWTPRDFPARSSLAIRDRFDAGIWLLRGESILLGQFFEYRGTKILDVEERSWNF